MKEIAPGCLTRSSRLFADRSPRRGDHLLFRTHELIMFIHIIYNWGFSLIYELIMFIHIIYDSEKAMAPHSSTLAWKIPWTEEPGGLQSMGR